MLKDSKFLIYCGAPLTFAAVTLPILPSAAAFCVDNRGCARRSCHLWTMNRHPLYARGPLTVSATGTLNVPRDAKATIKV
jgi:hypothetical protein